MPAADQQGKVNTQVMEPLEYHREVRSEVSHDDEGVEQSFVNPVKHLRKKYLNRTRQIGYSASSAYNRQQKDEKNQRNE